MRHKQQALFWGGLMNMSSLSKLLCHLISAVKGPVKLKILAFLRVASLPTIATGEYF